MICVHLLVDRCHKSILLIVQYKYIKSCPEEDFILQDLVFLLKL